METPSPFASMLMSVIGLAMAISGSILFMVTFDRDPTSWKIATMLFAFVLAIFGSILRSRAKRHERRSR